MALLDAIFTEIQDEKHRGNDLIGSCGFTTDPTDLAIQGPFVRGTEIFPKVANMIKSAESEVFLSLYKFQNDSYGGQEILAALEHLAIKATQKRQRISVKIMINHKRGPAALVSGDGRNSLIDMQRIQHLAGPLFDIQVTHHEHYFFNSNHSKALICDGQVAAVFTGDPTFKNSKDNNDNWVEAGTVCNNRNIAQGARNQFANTWNGTNVVALDKSNAKTNIAVQDEKVIIANPEGKSKTILFLGKTAISRPDTSNHSPNKIALLALLRNAKNNVCMMVNNLNDREILDALVACAQRGIKVSLVLGRYHGESAEALPGAGGTNITSVNYLLTTVSHLGKDNLDLRWLADDKGYLVQNMAAGTVHAKMTIVDESFVLTGSSPMDQQALRSTESDMLFESRPLATKYYQYVFAPVFDKSRTAKLSNAENNTRERILYLLKYAKKPSDFEFILKMYIAIRENEEKFTGFRSVAHFFSSQDTLSRDKKILDARNFLAEVRDAKAATLTVQRTDGLLAVIYNGYQAINKVNQLALNKQ